MNKLLKQNLQKLVTHEPVTEADIATATAYLLPIIDDEDIASMNEVLRKQNRVQITIVDLACVLALHCRSVIQNKGASPHKRFIRWSTSSRNLWAKQWTSCHIKVAMVTFSSLNLHVVDSEATYKKCTTYSVKKELLELFRINPAPKDEGIKH